MSEVYTKLEIITRPDKFEELKNALVEIGVEGMSVSNVMGAGTQKGMTTKYRGADYTAQLLPKIKVEVVISTTPVQDVVDKVYDVCRTGEIGDGKIFVYKVDNIFRIRTGESGAAAITNKQ
jgi:nitrogen regulatory protein P-II 1